MTTYATAEGSKRYAAKFPNAAPGHFREPVNCAAAPGVGSTWSPQQTNDPAPLLSSIGIGTYLGEANDATDSSYTAAITAAVEGGINVIDSAINYRNQRSERAIGAALRELARKGFSRDEIFLSTKGGYLAPDAAVAEDAHTYFQREYIAPGILRAQDVAAGCHAMSPSFLANQIDRSLANLGVDCVDLYYIHNPETQLGEVPRDEFLRRLHEAFAFLESAVSAGKIRFYGLATWGGFRQPADAKDYLSLSECEQAARDVVKGAHHFRFVQLPFNLGMTEALTRDNQSVRGPAVPMVQAAEALGINLMASASLSQAKMTKGLPQFIADAFGLKTDAERAIQFVRSSPEIITALVGMSRVEHVQANLRLVSEPAASAEQYAKLFARGQKA